MTTVTLLTTLLLLPNLPLAYPSHQGRDLTNSSKAGLAWGGGDGSNMDQFTSTGKVAWYYTWSPKSYLSNVPDSLEYVPMLWGQDQVDQWTETINDTLSSGNVHMVLGMNEPQEVSQSNLTPAEGAAMWKQYINPLRTYFPGTQLGSPAPSSASSGKTWLLEFLDACDGCTVDFIALHWYYIGANNFIEYMEDMHQTFNRPIAVTEWSCQNFASDNQSACTQEGVADFLNTTQAFLDRTDWIKMYAYFGALLDIGGINQADRLISSDGKITALGEQYIGAQGAEGTSAGVNEAIRNANVRWILGVLIFIQLASVFVV